MENLKVTLDIVQSKIQKNQVKKLKLRLQLAIFSFSNFGPQPPNTGRTLPSIVLIYLKQINVAVELINMSRLVKVVFKVVDI